MYTILDYILYTQYLIYIQKRISPRMNFAGYCYQEYYKRQKRDKS